MNIDAKYNLLIKNLSCFKRILVAFSGGMDSSFLLFIAKQKLGVDNVIAATSISPIHPYDEINHALKFAKKLGIKHILVNTSELKDKRFLKNDINRCFYCKDELYKTLSKEAKKNNMLLCDGTNYSDLNDYRPGLKAAEKWKVISPLVISEITKKDIYLISKKMNIPILNLYSNSCLATRISHKIKINSKDLHRIYCGERYMKKLGFSLIRLRHHGDLVRIELGESEDKDLFWDKTKYIVNYLKRLGWHYITFDLEGYRMGSFNL